MKLGKCSVFVSILILLLFQSGVSTGNDIIKFDQGTITIPTSMFGGFLIDQDGFIWVGTTGLGAMRYDGYELKSFAASIQGSMVSSIVEDRDGTIWFASFSNGITSYDKNTGKFRGYTHDSSNINSLSSNNISFTPHKLFVDESNTLWVGTDEAGLCAYNKTTDAWARYKQDINNSNSLGDNRVMAITGGRNDALWIGTQNGLDLFNPKTGTWKHYRHDPDDQDSLSDNWINALLVDRDGMLWIGTKSGGLDRLDEETGVFSHYSHNPSNPRSISSNDVWSLYEDSSGRIWISHMVSPGSGLDVLEKQSGIFTRYGHDSNNPKSISSNAITRIYEDKRTETLWAVNFIGRIDKQSKSAIDFKNWYKDPGNTNSLSDNAVVPIFEDSQKVVWAGTISGGLNRIDRKTGKVTHYKTDPDDPFSIPRNRITAISEDSSGTLWLGFWDGILASFDRDTARCIRIYEHTPNDPQSITKSERLKYIIEDKDDPNILWLATIKGGLDKFDKKREVFTHFKHVPDTQNSLSHNSITTLYDDGKGVLWVPTYGQGLDRFDKNTEGFKNYRHDAGNPNSLGSDTLYEVLAASDGKLWISSKAGISYFDPKSGSFKNFDKDEDGVPYGPTGSLLRDNDGNLWLGTVGKGIVRFDPRTGSTERFTEDDGLQSNTNFWTSRFKSRNGEIWFGGPNGISSFSPAKMNQNPHIPPIVLTAFTQGGDPLDTETSPERLKDITLSWRNNYFEFQFAAMDLTSPKKNRYAYMLEGWDESWYDAGSNPFGRYSGLDGGRYILRLKGSNNEGIWNNEGASVTVIVTSPFWKTYWFFASLISTGSIILLSFMYYTWKLRKETIERKLAEESLRESEERFRLLVESLPQLIFLGQDGKFIYGNPAGVTALGYADKDDIVGLDILQAFESDYRETIATRLNIIQESKINPPIEVKMIDRNGENLWVLSSSVPVKLDGKNTTILVGQDMTEKKRMENELIQSHKMEAIGILAGGIAHDFNNVLAAIIGFTELSLDDVKPGTNLQDNLQEVYKAGKRAKELVWQILTFARQTDEPTKPVQADSIIKEVLKFIRSSTPNTIEIKSKISSASLIMGNPTQLHQIIMNLCTNAAHAMEKAGGILKIILHDVTVDKSSPMSKEGLKPGDYIELKVSDTGVGIPPEVIDSIFQPYFTTKATGEGTGMGLAVVLGIVEKYGGKLSVVSIVGKGSSFSVFLPITKKDKVDPLYVVEKLATGTERILFVDDEAAIAKMGTKTLESIGYRVTTRTSSVEALELFKAKPNKFDLVITDMTMRNMTGDILAVELMKIRHDIPIILCTGYSNKISDESAKGIGIKAFAYKPIVKADLAKTIRIVLDEVKAVS